MNGETTVEMPVQLIEKLRNVRSTRDLRAEILEQAARCLSREFNIHLVVVDPVISAVTVQSEWDRLLPALAAEVRDGMTMTIERTNWHALRRSRGENLVPLAGPNYTYEVLRLLVGASMQGDGPQTISGIIENIGASQTPVRQALIKLKDAGIIRGLRKLDVSPERLSMEMLGRVGAIPQSIRFRFERGAQIASPRKLMERACSLLRADSPRAWTGLSLSGVPVALADAPEIDLVGVPRVDLIAQVGREVKNFDPEFVRLLDDGLEPEPNVLSPAPVVITIARARKLFFREAALGDVRCADPMDVFFALLDGGLRDQAIQYARSMRQ